MKALSVKQPWASQIVAGTKTAEYRNWRADYRGVVVIAASKTPATPDAVGLPRGCLLGVVDLVDIAPAPADSGYRFAWVLANPRPFAEPIPCTGRRGLWELPNGWQAL